MPSPIPPTERTCERCGETFTATDSRKRFCTDNCRKRKCEESHRASCIDCGDSLSAGSAWKGRLRCQPCWSEFAWEQHADRDRQIEEWWNEGLSLREIGERLGWTEKHLTVEIHRLREAGYNLPYRHRGYDRFPEQVPA